MAFSCLFGKEKGKRQKTGHLCRAFLKREENIL